MRAATHIEKKSEVSEQILDAAERLLKTYGYQKMTMSDLAVEAGIGVGTIYLYFSSKSEVALAVVDRSHNQMMLSLQTIVASDLPHPEIIREFLRFRIFFHFDRCREMLQKISWQQFHRYGIEFRTDINAAAPDRPASWRQSEIKLLGRAIQAGIDAKAFISVEPETTASTLLSATCGFMPSSLNQSDFEAPELFADRVQKVISLLIDGFVVVRSSRPLSELEITTDSRLPVGVYQ